MTLEEIAGQLVRNCREQRTIPGLEELYDEAAESVEAFVPEGSDQDRITKGRAGIRGKHEWWDGAFEVHSLTVDGPYLHGPAQFAVMFEFDATEKASGQRWQMKEIGLYSVRDGRIVKEEFFSPPMPA